MICNGFLIVVILWECFYSSYFFSDCYYNWVSRAKPCGTARVLGDFHQHVKVGVTLSPKIRDATAFGSSTCGCWDGVSLVPKMIDEIGFGSPTCGGWECKMRDVIGFGLPTCGVRDCKSFSSSLRFLCPWFPR